MNLSQFICLPKLTSLMSCSMTLHTHLTLQDDNELIETKEYFRVFYLQVSMTEENES